MTISLKVATWNANRLIENELELKNFLRQEKIDVVLASETHFTNETLQYVTTDFIPHTTHPIKLVVEQLY